MTRNFEGPIQTIIPWATNAFTEAVIERVKRDFGTHFRGFWMLGGMSGGGMGFIFDPSRKQAAEDSMPAIMSEARRELESGLAFAMQPVVYDFAINERGSCADLLPDDCALLPRAYYELMLPGLLRRDPHMLSASEAATFCSSAQPSRRLPISRPRSEGWSAGCFHRLPARMGAAPVLWRHCSTSSASTRRNTRPSGRNCAPAGSGWPRTGCPFRR